jgi:hypothetical protein
LAFEEYQFLRYFIPGSIYVVYTTALLLPILNSTVIDFFRKDTSALLGIVGAALGASLAAGYIIYTIYDTFGYSPRMMNRDKRKMLKYIDDNIDGWKEPIDSSKKEFLDLLLIKFGESSSGDRYSATVKSMWSHLNARIVCYLYVPVLSAISVPTIMLYSTLIARKALFFFDLGNILLLVIVTVFIIFISLILKLGSDRPMNEGTTLEYFFFTSIIKDELKEKDYKTLLKNLGLTIKETKA